MPSYLILDMQQGPRTTLDVGVDSQHNAFRVLFEEHYNSFYAAAMRYLRNPHDAEELVQEAACKAWAAFDKFQQGTNFKAWMHKILYNTFINKYRISKKERVNMEGLYDGRNPVDRLHAVDPYGHPEDVVNNVLPDELQEALDSLPDIFREPVVLCDLQDMTYKEIAAALDIPLGTVMSRLYRGRKLLRVVLGGEAVEMGILDFDSAIERGWVPDDLEEVA